MNRISHTIHGLGRGKLLIPFFTVGYPDFKTSMDLVRTAVSAGADIVELGMPFSDPLADGPAIQHSSKVAIDNGVNLRKILEGVGQLRSSIQNPIVLMGYVNPVLAYGTKKFLRAAHRQGVDGLIIPDLPIEESLEFTAMATSERISQIFLVAPTTSRLRITEIDLASADLVYAVTVTGVTGGEHKFGPDTYRYFRHLRRSLSKPFVAGFGVSSPQIARDFCRLADGVVIGSALVGIVGRARTPRQGVQAAGKFLQSVRTAIDQLSTS